MRACLPVCLLPHLSAAPHLGLLSCMRAEALPRALEQIKATQTIAADIEAFVKQTLGV